MLNCRLKALESGRDVVLMEMLQDFPDISLHIGCVCGPEDSVVMREHWLDFGIEDVLVQVDDKGKVIGG